jgi:hypothetical protein
MFQALVMSAVIMIIICQKETDLLSVGGIDQAVGNAIDANGISLVKKNIEYDYFMMMSPRRSV